MIVVFSEPVWVTNSSKSINEILFTLRESFLLPLPSDSNGGVDITAKKDVAEGIDDARENVSIESALRRYWQRPY